MGIVAKGKVFICRQQNI